VKMCTKDLTVIEFISDKKKDVLECERWLVDGRQKSVCSTNLLNLCFFSSSLIVYQNTQTKHHQQQEDSVLELSIGIEISSQTFVSLLVVPIYVIL